VHSPAMLQLTTLLIHIASETHTCNHHSSPNFAKFLETRKKCAKKVYELVEYIARFYY
jgi:hypothetical protein